MRNFKDPLSSVYADPTADVVFKKIFGTHEYSLVTIDVINSFIKGLNITEVSFLNTVLNRESKTEATSIVDILARDGDGNHFVIEMQRIGHEYFRERMVFYASKVIAALKRGEYVKIVGTKDNSPKKKNKQNASILNYNIKGTYIIAFLNYDFAKVEHDPDLTETIVHYETINRTTGRKMPAAPEYFFVQLKASEEKAVNATENEKKWISLLKHSAEMVEIPDQYKDDPVMEAYFKASKIANMTSEEQVQYVNDMTTLYDIHNAMLEHEAKGKAEGLAEGLAEGEAKAMARMAKSLKDKGYPLEDIAECSGLSVEQIQAL